ncbi:hypothetical protein GOBAR_DD33295 [Gossypium barbadense]|nr:hypothetical protein GOBAR_DD33295 [Gossypium barbadense]
MVNSEPPLPRKELSPRGGKGVATTGASNRIYVGNLSWRVDDLALEALFAPAFFDSLKFTYILIVPVVFQQYAPFVLFNVGD